jgi:DNA polymerase IV (DinB-like DNA polymerase)
MDAFFASIEERDNPRLAGRPIVVGADPEDGHGRGVVSTANYAARAYGIRSALPISTAWKFSEAARAKGLPPAAFLDVNMQKYAEVSGRIMEILSAHVPPDADGVVLVQQASVDEAYFDLSFAGSYERTAEIVCLIKDEIKMKEHLTASVGVGPNKLIAKIASDQHKPDGLTIVHEEDAETFLEPLSLRVIPGIGPKAEEQFKRRGMRTVRDAKSLSSDELKEMMGKGGTDLYKKLRGKSDSPIVMDSVQKSISSATTFAHDVAVRGILKDRKLLEATLTSLGEDVYRSLRAEIAGGAPFTSFRSVGITVRFGDFTTKTRVVTLKDTIEASSVSSLKELQFQALRLFMPFLDGRDNPQHKSIRLLSVKVERFI